jgi:hypothetical protein
MISPSSVDATSKNDQQYDVAIRNILKTCFSSFSQGLKGLSMDQFFNTLDKCKDFHAINNKKIAAAPLAIPLAITAYEAAAYVVGLLVAFCVINDCVTNAIKILEKLYAYGNTVFGFNEKEQEVYNQAVKEHFETRVLGKRKPTVRRPVQFPINKPTPEKISREDSQKGRCKPDVNKNPGVLSSIVVYDKVYSTDVTATVNKKPLKKDFIICVQKGVVVPPEFIAEIATEFKNIIFPLVSSITGTARNSPFIYLKISNFKPDCKVQGMFCNSNEIHMPPLEHRLHALELLSDIIHGKKTAKLTYFGNLAHEYTHMVDHQTLKQNFRIPWNYSLFSEGFAVFSQFEYWLRKDKDYYMHQRVHFFKNFSKFSDMTIVQNSNKCFLDTKQNDFYRFEKGLQTKILYRLGGFFMKYIHLRFNGINGDGLFDTKTLLTIKYYQIFNTLVSSDLRLDTLKNQVSNKLKEDWKTFCDGFKEHIEIKDMLEGAEE